MENGAPGKMERKCYEPRPNKKHRTQAARSLVHYTHHTICTKKENLEVKKKNTSIYTHSRRCRVEVIRRFVKGREYEGRPSLGRE